MKNMPISQTYNAAYGLQPFEVTETPGTPHRQADHSGATTAGTLPV